MHLLISKSNLTTVCVCMCTSCCRIPPGIKLWAPVMGVPGRGLFVQWSNGEVSSSCQQPSAAAVCRGRPWQPMQAQPQFGVDFKLLDSTQSLRWLCERHASLDPCSFIVFALQCTHCTAPVLPLYWLCNACALYLYRLACSTQLVYRPAATLRMNSQSSTGP